MTAAVHGGGLRIVVPGTSSNVGRRQHSSELLPFCPFPGDTESAGV